MEPLKKNLTLHSPSTVVYLEVNLTNRPESGLQLFRGWREMPKGDIADMCADHFYLYNGERVIGLQVCEDPHREEHKFYLYSSLYILVTLLGFFKFDNNK